MAIKANNQITARQGTAQKKGFSAIINGEEARKMIERNISDPQRTAAFISTLVSVVNATPKLKECEPGSIISAALRGEIGMGLSVVLGEYSIVPYVGKNGAIAQFQLGANGLKQICVRTGAYRRIKFRPIREGAFGGYDEFGDPVILWEKNNDAEKPIIGYYGAYELRNGFGQSLYWTHDECLHHANRYAPAFSLDTYNDLLSGKITGWEAKKLRGGSPWYAAPDELPHIKMCLKTVAKQLLSDGLAPKEVLAAIHYDDEEERNPGTVIPEESLPLYDQPIDSTAEETEEPAEAEPKNADDAVLDAEQGFFG